MAEDRNPGHHPTFILASASPRRHALLEQIGLFPDAIVPAEVEEAALPNESPRDLAKRLARLKAETVARACPGAVVLGADTVVACGRRVLPKPVDRADAARMLSMLSGRRHRVIGGVCVIDAEGRARERLVATQVVFKRLEAAEISAYSNMGEWCGKAGAYAIQGHAARFVRLINGSYSNVVGLPLFETAALLADCGIVPKPVGGAEACISTKS